MLTKELITQNEALKGLTEEQTAAIVKLSENDEARVIGDKVREIHDQYDRDIKEITGLDKPADKKTYAHLKEVLADFKAKAEDGPKALQAELDKLKAQNADLEKKIKEGRADDHLKDKVAGLEKDKADLANRINELQGKLEKDKAEWKQRLDEKEAALHLKDIEFQFANDLAGMKFMDEKFIPKQVRETYISAAKTALLSKYNPVQIDDGAGGKRLAFEDKATKRIVNNPENQLNPFTSAELLAKELEPILDKGRQQNGAGTGSGAGTPASLALSLSGVANQVQADEAIQAHLAAKGMAAGTKEYRDEFQKIRQENGVEKLPLGFL